ncbi:MAG: hypothetical protein OJF59_000333 [Cytophagales bacterium]|nr:MAG: hypothetical protein OJF59_000333 [Cytophagales bacterium]
MRLHTKFDFVIRRNTQRTRRSNNSLANKNGTAFILGVSQVE